MRVAVGIRPCVRHSQYAKDCVADNEGRAHPATRHEIATDGCPVLVIGRVRDTFRLSGSEDLNLRAV